MVQHHMAEGRVWIKVIPLAKVIERKGNTSIAFVTEAHLLYGIENIYLGTTTDITSNMIIARCYVITHSCCSFCSFSFSSSSILV